MNERAPVQGETHDPQGRRVHRPSGTISWEEHVCAWNVYAEKYGTGQSAQRIADRGGFSWYELIALLGHDPLTWEPT